MSYVRFASRAQRLWPALLIVALPTACAEGVTPDLENAGEPGSTAGATAGGSSGESGSGSGLPQAGTTVTSAGSNASPFGGTSSSAGSASAGSASAGSASAGTAGTSVGGTSAGGTSAGGTSVGGSHTGGSAGASAAGGGGGGSCACGKTVKWVDNTSISWVKGDCVDVDGKLYLYAGTLPQTYANGPCNPTMQAAWCTDSGNDYKFTLCM